MLSDENVQYLRLAMDNVSDTIPTLAPFLNGGSGFIGPVAYPSTVQYNAALAGEKTMRVPTFTAVF